MVLSFLKKNNFFFGIFYIFEESKNSQPKNVVELFSEKTLVLCCWLCLKLGKNNKFFRKLIISQEPKMWHSFNKKL